MPLFAVIGTVNPDAIRESIVRQYGANHYQLSPTSWFVTDTGTTKEVADKLGMTSGPSAPSQGAVIKIAAYSGRAPAAAWTWLQSGGEAIPNG